MEVSYLITTVLLSAVIVIKDVMFRAERKELVRLIAAKDASEFRLLSDKDKPAERKKTSIERARDAWYHKSERE